MRELAKPDARAQPSHHPRRFHKASELPSTIERVCNRRVPRILSESDVQILPARYNLLMKFRVVLDYDREAASYSAVCPELPGCTSAGETEAEARQGIEEAIRLYLSSSELELPSSAKLVEVTVG